MSPLDHRRLSASNGISIGSGTTVTGQYGIAIGDAATAALNGIAIGTSATALTTQVIIGSGVLYSYFGIYDTSGFGWHVLSDEQLKTNICDSYLGLKFINKLQLRNFTVKAQPEIGICVGFIAQEVEKVAKEEMPGWQIVKDVNGLKTFGLNGLIGPLVKSIQQLTARVEELERKLHTKQS